MPLGRRREKTPRQSTSRIQAEAYQATPGELTDHSDCRPILNSRRLAQRYLYPHPYLFATYPCTTLTLCAYGNRTKRMLARRDRDRCSDTPFSTSSELRQTSSPPRRVLPCRELIGLRSRHRFPRSGLVEPDRYDRESVYAAYRKQSDRIGGKRGHRQMRTIRQSQHRKRPADSRARSQQPHLRVADHAHPYVVWWTKGHTYLLALSEDWPEPL